ncbi:hypothetical protein [Actinoplanes rectilineatus]|uniref:hypothetical protein n=1 Tax=Actinoplanes rectilineatus TaxID=113571 RepID=UPI0005F2AF0A|nr:hypothetical protein [Actinoplanes rectilineatus]
MSTAVSPTTGGSITPNTAGPGTALAAPGGTGAAGAATMSMVRMTALLEQARKALLILQDVGVDLLRESAATKDTADYLTASFGERISLEEIVTIATMLGQIADASLNVVAQGHDSVRAALAANFQVLVVQEQLHALGADGGYVDSQRRAG